MSNKENLILHPFLFAVYPILFYYNLNNHQVWFSEIIISMLISLAAAFLLLYFFKFIFKKTTKAGILASLTLILFFSYEAVQTSLAGSNIGDFVLELDPSLFWSYGISLILLWTGVKICRSNFFSFTRFLNVVSVILIIFSVSNVGIHKIQIHLEKPNVHEKDLDYSSVPDAKPDIYYIIVDSYTSGENLKTFWKYDNNEFLSYLTQKGFYVAKKSRSNYMHTGYSMPSSLNMKYINDLGKVKSKKVLAPYLREMTADNKVAQFLKSIGYSYIHIGDSVRSGVFDHHITYRNVLSPYAEYLANKTWLKSLKLDIFNPDQIKRNSIPYLFKKLGEMPELEQPKFVYAHIMVPHPPFTFDRDGNVPKQEYLNMPKILYPNQVAFVNKKLVEFIDKLLSKSKIQPIIIIQGDHGYEPSTGLTPDEKDHRRVFGILNAYYLPKNGRQKLHESITPVNTFRLIFDNYFGTSLGLLPDKSYFRFPFSDSWKFISIPGHPTSMENPLTSVTANSEWIQSLEEYVLNNPNFYDSRVVLGSNYYLVNRTSEAIEQLEKAVQIDPNIAMAHIFLAINYFRERNYSKAAEAANQATRLDPKMARAYGLTPKEDLAEFLRG